MIKVFRLISSETVIGTLDVSKSNEVQVTLTKPAILHIVPGRDGKPTVALLPYSVLPGVLPGVAEASFKTNHILSDGEIPTELQDAYVQATTGIVISKTNPFSVVK